MKFDKHHLIALGLTLTLFLLLGAIYSGTRLFTGMELGSINFRFYLRATDTQSQEHKEGVKKGRAKKRMTNPRARKDLVILGIDENTIRNFTKKKINWPFPWDKYAQFTNYVSSGKPLAIFYDIMFLDHKPFEKELAAAIKKAGNVYLDFPFEKSDEDDFFDHDQRRQLLYRVRFPADPSDTSEDLVKEAVPPTPLITEAARGIGFANVFPGEDSVNRTMPLIIKFKNWYYPNIDLVVAMHYFGITAKDVEIKYGQYIKLKNLPVEKMKIPNKEREIVIPIDENGFMYINFIGGAGSFTHYPFHLFCRDGTMGKNTSLKDKIIFVAAYAATGIATDEKKSPYGTTFGIEHHANALNTILNQDFLYQLDDMENLLVMLCIALFLGLLLTRVSIIKSVIITGVFGLVYFLGSYIIFNYASIIIAVSTPMIQIGLTFSLIISYRVMAEQKEKKYIRQTFSKFVSKSVVDDLLKHPDKIKLGGERKILTVLFSDIRGFTSISEKLTPEELVEHLNVYLQEMTNIIISHLGTLDKYVGDEIMAFWGAPVPQENHALLACKAAIIQMEALNRLNENWRLNNKPPLDIGIGINTGDMVVGNMGSASRMDYTLMGDNVNLGARLEGTNKVYKTHIIISEYTYEHVRDQVIVRELDLIKVKGKEQPVKIYELVDVKE
ncbi:MAG: adenylate/guanylate cyclase domain-containing protein [bacterium]|nr:adenylate/guanylate cyclase domain-containing protein [bacterium]